MHFAFCACGRPSLGVWRSAYHCWNTRHGSPFCHRPARHVSRLLPASPCSPPTRRRRRRCSPTYATSPWRCTATRWPRRESSTRRSTRLLATPDDATLAAAREAWLAARVPYQQTEVFRFGNPIVDDWEGRVNAWPLDEGLIDYVDVATYGDSSDENPLYAANVIANPQLRIGPASRSTPRTIDAGAAGGSLQEVARRRGERRHRLSRDRVPALGPGPERHRPRRGQPAGQRLCLGRRLHQRQLRPARAPISRRRPTCWSTICRRWSATGRPAARRAAVAELRRRQAGLATILTGLGSLSYGELAGERMKLGLLLHDPEEEHDCFSDNTHNSHYYDQVGMVAIWIGRYDGHRRQGHRGPEPGRDLAAARRRRPRPRSTTRMAETLAADAGDQGHGRLAARWPTTRCWPRAMRRATRMIQAGGRRAGRADARRRGAWSRRWASKIAFEGSDSLDNPSAGEPVAAAHAARPPRPADGGGRLGHRRWRCPCSGALRARARVHEVDADRRRATDRVSCGEAGRRCRSGPTARTGCRCCGCRRATGCGRRSTTGWPSTPRSIGTASACRTPRTACPISRSSRSSPASASSTIRAARHRHLFFHPHCDTAEQLGRGLAGMLIVEGDERAAVDADLVVAMRDWRIDEAGEVPAVHHRRGRQPRRHVRHPAHGQRLPSPTLAVPAGGDVRLRLLNLDNTRVMELGFEGAEAALIAIDGNRAWRRCR